MSDYIVKSFERTMGLKNDLQRDLDRMHVRVERLRYVASTGEPGWREAAGALLRVLEDEIRETGRKISKLEWELRKELEMWEDAARRGDEARDGLLSLLQRPGFGFYETLRAAHALVPDQPVALPDEVREQLLEMLISELAVEAETQGGDYRPLVYTLLYYAAGWFGLLPDEAKALRSRVLGRLGVGAA